MEKLLPLVGLAGSLRMWWDRKQRIDNRRTIDLRQQRVDFSFKGLFDFHCVPPLHDRSIACGS